MMQFDKFYKRLIFSILKRYIDNFLKDVSIQDFEVRLREGTGSIENACLNIEKLNKYGSEYNLPFEFLEGHIGLISLSVPWRSLLSDSSVLILRGLHLVMQPKERPEDVSMFDSMWNSMTSSIQLVTDAMNDDKVKMEVEDTLSYNEKSKGLDMAANLIDTVLANLKVKIEESSLKLEYIPGISSCGVSLEMKIDRAEYFDEESVNSQAELKTTNSNEPSAYSFKKIIFDGISLYTSEFSSLSRKFPIIPIMQDYMDPENFIPGSPEMPPPHCSLPMKKTEEFEEEPILISKLLGQQELKLKLKNNEAFIGPKVDIEFNLGAFNLFLVPKQVYILIELLTGVLCPTSSNSDNHVRLSVTNKPMLPADFALVKKVELEHKHKQKYAIPTKSLTNQGWSSHSIDDSDDDFHSMIMESKHANDYTDNESLSSSMSSDITRSDGAGQQFSTSVSRRSRHSSSVQALIQDQLSELTHFRGVISSCCIIILHDDSVQESLSAGLQDSVHSNSNKSISLKQRAEQFFDDLKELQQSEIDLKDFTSSRDPLSKLCETNHLRLNASSISIDGNEKSSSAQCILNFNLVSFQFEIIECLFNSANLVKAENQKSPVPTYEEIFCENRAITSNESSREMRQSCLKLKYQQIDYSAENRCVKPPTNKLDVQLGPVSCEFDISLIDRIQTLLSFQYSFSQNFNSKKEDWKDSDIVMTAKSSLKTDINLSSPHLRINLRFPIPDLRPINSSEHLPWWQQNLHKEILVMELKDATFGTTLEGDISKAKYEMQCRDFHGLFQISSESDPISFLRVSVDPEVDEASQEGGFDWPRLVIHKTTPTFSVDLQTDFDEPEESYMYSISEELMSNLKTELSPFCSTPLMYSNKVHKDIDSSEGNTDASLEHDEVIKPADKETMNEFMEKVINKTEYFFEFILPTVNIIFPSKELFEMIYNRLGKDLLLWQRTPMVSSVPYDINGFKVHVPGLDLESLSFKDSSSILSKSYKPFQNESDSDDEESSLVTYHDYWQRQKQKHRKQDPNHPFTDLTILLAITKGKLAISTLVMDETNNLSPDVCGKLELYVEDSQIFIASSYKGDPDEGYVCILADKSSLHHKAVCEVDKNGATVQPLSSSRGNLERIIYQSEPGMCIKSFDKNCNTMLKVVVHMVNNPKQQLKSFKVALDISDATLRHFTHSVPQMWINQMIEFLKVQDNPVIGYTPSSVVTEFHLNLSSCAVDYRPLKLPVWSCITVENFNMSCNISATTPSFIFRIISEEMRIFLSNTVTARKIDLRKNFVCVVDTGLIDVYYKTICTETEKPKIEVNASNNIIHVRTCSDSFKALLDLLYYLSINGDMETVTTEPREEPAKNKNMSTTSKESNDADLILLDAMQDNLPNKSSNNFEDGNSNLTDEYQYDQDDEFVILDEDPGLGLMPKNGEPEVRILTDEPFNIIENHFSVPPGKSDELKAPKHYPNPVKLVALKEMSLVWHMYGGSDFKSNAKKKHNKKQTGVKNLEVTFADEDKVEVSSNKSSVSFCKITPMMKNLDESTVYYSMEYLNIEQNVETCFEQWLQKGGPYRNQAVLMELQINKLKFQREIYPDEGEYASHYVLLIHDIEIRDRLDSSKLNKFLYQYSSQKIPRQTNANMIEVKALYTRPDLKKSIEECSLKISCKPLRLFVDQDALFFLIGFFQEVLESGSDDNSEGDSDSSDVMARSSVRVAAQVASSKRSSTPETFYRYFSFCPDVLIRVDYQGKHIQMEEGALKGLILGLTQLNNSEIKLKRFCYRNGLLGHHKLFAHATTVWQEDILRHQLQNVISGVGPLNSIVQLFQGFIDLFYLPVAQYQKDGQIIRGIQRGASSFSTSSVMAILDLTSRLFTAIQGIAIISCDMVSPGPSVANKLPGSQDSYRQTSQPADIREGITTAISVFKEGVEDTLSTLYQATSTEHEHKGVLGAVGGCLRQIPPTLFRPIILSAASTNHVLGGIRHQLVPDAHEEDMQKWKTKSS